jgi:hypothetical protein
VPQISNFATTQTSHVKHATLCAEVMEKISVEDDFLSNVF